MQLSKKIKPDGVVNKAELQFYERMEKARFEAYRPLMQMKCWQLAGVGLFLPLHFYHIH